MASKILPIILGLLILISCQKEMITILEVDQSELGKQIDQSILEQIKASGEVFDWNEQTDEFICKALSLTDYVFAVGFEFNAIGKRNLADYLQSHGDLELDNTNDKLGIYYLRSKNCDHITAIRNLEGIQYLELDHFPSDISSLITPFELPEEDIDYRSSSRVSDHNPGAYVPGSGPYLNFLDDFEGSIAANCYNHNMDKVYHEMGYYGSASTGIAIIDNGVYENKVAYLSVGPGGFVADGYFIRNWWNPSAENDGPHPQPTDFFGIWQQIPAAYGHGTSMSENAYATAPFAHRKTLRASPTYLIITAIQMRFIANAITDMADDPQIKVISMSMAGPFAHNQMRSAIRYFNSKNKIMFAAAGSSAPILRDALGMLFPARTPETISTTGIEDMDDTDGVMVLGELAHGGIRNDFVYESAESSSSSVSTLAGMFTVIWDINPSLDREDFFQMMIENSNYYLEQGSKHPKFGWGKVDMYGLALDVEETL